MRKLLCLFMGAGMCAGPLLLTSCGTPVKPDANRAEVAPATAAVDAARLLAADENPGEWITHGRTYSEQRFSPLRQINTDNVSQLGLAWFADFDTRRGQESTPIVVDGVIYVTTAWSKVRAYDAVTGEQVWAFDPKVPGEWAANACCDVVNRGVAVWNGKVYVGTIDGRLIALDAATGKPVWDVYTIDRTKPYAITGAPRIIKGKVFIGQGGAEFSARGYVSAYDAETGKLAWRWYTVPGNPSEPFENAQMEMAAKTWGGSWWKAGGGGTVWDAITYDPQTDLVFIGVGNGGPWPAEVRDPGGKGDHLFLSSIVALRPDTGEYVWHYQQVQRDSWDYTATQQITVADLRIDGKDRHVVMQAPKNGYFYVLDAASGALVSAQPFVPVNWSTGIDMKSGRPIMNPAARFDVTGKGFIQVPSFAGGHSWHPMSYSPQTGLVYIPAMNMSYAFVLAHEDDNPMGQKLSISFAKSAAMVRDPSALRANEGYLLAWDPVQQKEAWRVSHGAARGGGTLATAGGLVFQGNTANLEFAAYRADNGEKLWNMTAHTGVLAGPVTYEIKGSQYVAAVAGFQRPGVGNYYAPNYSRLLVFKLGGTAQLPPKVTVPPMVLNPPPAFGTAELVSHGEEIYGRFCSTCHGNDGLSRGMFPDLRYSTLINSAVAFKTVVIDGALASNGMVSFAKGITLEDTEAVRAYLVARAHEAKNNPPLLPPGQVAVPPVQARPHAE